MGISTNARVGGNSRVIGLNGKTFMSTFNRDGSSGELGKGEKKWVCR